ncbi:MAG: type II toxin-antitoxin system PemK/MazF family toxin [Verrucomicrobia bacterium]|nr:type II toxin-antitoxin system PemK/MazF family toxin [Verrucomicrobiota bacterium]
MTAKVLMRRLSEEAYQRTTALAAQRQQSLNRLFQDGLLLLDQQEREKRLFDDFTAIAEAGTNETDVEFAIEAQTRAITGATHVEVVPDARNGLRLTSWVKCEQILTISKDRLISTWGALSPQDMTRVEAAVRTVLSL